MPEAVSNERDQAGEGSATANDLRFALLMLGLVAALFIWWEWKQAAYFGPVFYPAAIGIFGLFAVLLVNTPVQVRIGGPARVALVALLGIAGWTLLSILWSDVPSAAPAYAERVFVYAVLFVVGAWAASLLGRRMHLALAPVALTGAVVGVATTIVLATGTDITWYLQGDATLRFPIGYRNADTAFLLICLWPLLGLATDNEWRWPLRALMVAAATMLVELAVLGQSRGSLPALVLAILVYLALTPHRLRAGAVIGLALIPVIPALPDLLAVFRHDAPDAGAIPLLHQAARTIGLTSALSLGVSALAFGVVYPRLDLGPARVRALSWVVGIVAVLAAVAGGLVFVDRHGGPIGFIDQRASEFGHTGYPNLHGQGVRFGANIGSNRHDFWRVAVDEGIDHPVLGGGAGSFQLAYLRHRQSPETPHDPHSIEAVIFSELGMPGLILLVLFVGGAGWAALRSRAQGPVAASLVATAAAGGVQWFVHGSFDWFWQYAGVSALGIYLLGVAAAPGLRGERPGRAVGMRSVAVACLVGLALLAIPLFLSDRYLERGNQEARSDPAKALADLGRAADLNPWSDDPLLSKGVVQAGLGERQAAISAFRQAADREPDNYAAYYFIAQELAGVDHAAAIAALAHARELNPRDRAIAAFGRELAK